MIRAITKTALQAFPFIVFVLERPTQPQGPEAD
jgi:hypothetical protein